MTWMVAAVLTASPALDQTLAQTPASPRPTAANRRADACRPIGRTEDGKLVYSMTCDTIPAPAPKAASASATAAAPAAESPAPEVEEDKGGLFGMHAPSFIRPTNEQQRPAGVGPAAPR